MLQVFYLNVTYVCNDFQIFFNYFFLSVSETCLSISSIFSRMLKVLHVSKVDQLLDMRCAWETRGASLKCSLAVQAHVGVRNAAGQRRASASSGVECSRGQETEGSVGVHPDSGRPTLTLPLTYVSSQN